MVKSAALLISAIVSMSVQSGGGQLSEEIKQQQIANKSEAQITAQQELIETEFNIKDHSSLSNSRKDWYFRRNSNHTPPGAQTAIDLKQYNGCYLGDTEKKEIYLTYDCGYENGLMPEILDVLKEKQVPAAFFVLKGYITRHPELVKRMVEEGHTVANHSSSHKNFNELSGSQIEKELKDTAACFEEVTGKKMPRFFRPPSGVYSERVLAYLNDLGYKTVFWSFAYVDWEENNQPGKSTAYNMMVNNSHNGTIMLLHSVSKSNLEALPEAIDALREQGYEFKGLNELPAQ